jgi:hypothetical protein
MERETCEPSSTVLAVGPVLLAVQGEAVHDLRERAMLDEAGGWISCQQWSPTDDDQFGFGTLQMKNTLEVETVSGWLQVMKLVVRRLEPSTVTILAVWPRQFDS